MKADEIEFGKHYVVTGDEGAAGHGFEVGTVVEMRSTRVCDDGMTRVQYLDGSDYWWVHPRDLEPYVPVDMVNKPPHYNSHPKGIECLDVVEINPYYNLGTAMKYLWRVSWGGKFDDLEDLKKAVFYINREIERREGQGA